MLITTCLELLRNSEAMRRGEFVLREEFVADYLRSRIEDDVVKHIGVSLQHQHCVLDLNVGRAGLLYRWTNSFCLRAADLNTDPRVMVFEQPNGGRVGPVNLAAKAVRFSPMLIPKIGLLVGQIIRLLIDHLVRSLINRGVRDAAETVGFTVKGNRWLFELSTAEHPAFTTVKVPLLGARSLIGGIVIIKRIDLTDGLLRVGLGLHPDIKTRLDILGPAARQFYEDIAGNEPAPEQEPDKAHDTTVPKTRNSVRSFLNQAIPLANNLRKSVGPASSKPDGVSSSLSDPEWLAELDTAPVLDVADLSITGAETLDLLDMLDSM